MDVDRRPFPRPDKRILRGRGLVIFDNSYCRAVGNSNCVQHHRINYADHRTYNRLPPGY